MNIELLKRQRKKLQLTQQQLADKCNLSRVTISNYESGKAEPTKENIEILSKVLKVPELLLLANPDKKINFNDKEFGGTVEEMQENLEEYIKKTIKKNRTDNDFEEITKSILNIIKVTTNFTPLYFKAQEKIIFVDFENGKVKTCPFELLEQYIFNLISLSENLVKFSKLDYFLSCDDTVFKEEKINFLEAKGEFIEANNYKLKRIKDCMESDFEIIDMSLKVFSIETIKSSLEQRYTESKNILNSKDVNEETKELFKEIDELYYKYITFLENNTFKQNKEGGSDE